MRYSYLFALGVLAFAVITDRSVQVYLGQQGKVSVAYGVAFAAPLVVLVLAFLAERGIRKDEALVKSLDRLRYRGMCGPAILLAPSFPNSTTSRSFTCPASKVKRNTVRITCPPAGRGAQAFQGGRFTIQSGWPQMKRGRRAPVLQHGGSYAPGPADVSSILVPARRRTMASNFTMQIWLWPQMKRAGREAVLSQAEVFLNARNSGGCH
ncbi:MAG: DUF4293 family protein [Flavobacteriales bacterium]|nr:DUF4293 family protein [Flavobacteriales bacterium]